MRLSVNTVSVSNIETGRPSGPPLHHTAMLMDDGRIYYGFGSPAAPTPTLVRAGGEPANAIAIAIIPMSIFVLDKRGDIFRRDFTPGAPATWVKDTVAKDVVGMDSDVAGTVWVINKKGEVYHTGTGLGSPAGWTRAAGFSTSSFWS